MKEKNKSLIWGIAGLTVFMINLCLLFLAENTIFTFILFFVSAIFSLYFGVIVLSDMGKSTVLKEKELDKGTLYLIDCGDCNDYHLYIQEKDEVGKIINTFKSKRKAKKEFNLIENQKGGKKK